MVSTCFLLALLASAEPADATEEAQRWFDTQAVVAPAPGTYRLTRSLVVELDKTGFRSLMGNGVVRFVMAGPGPAIKFVGNHAGTADPSSVKPEVWDRQRMPLVSGIEIVGEHAKAVGIEAVGTMQLTLTHLNIRKVRHAIHLRERNRNVLISDCHLYENTGIGLYLDDVNLHQINVTGSHISYNAMGGVVSKAGNVRNLHITGCDIEGNMGGANSAPSANVLLDSRDSEYGIGEVAITGCTIQHTDKGPDSANIRILGKSNRDHAEGHVTITGNVLSDVHTNIHLSGARGVVITGNTLWKGVKANIVVEDSSNVVLGNNSLDRNPRYTDGAAAQNHVIFRRCEDCTINGLHTNGTLGPAALVLRDCRRLHVTGCTLLNPSGPGILAERVTQSRIAGNFIHHSSPAETWQATEMLECVFVTTH